MQFDILRNTECQLLELFTKINKIRPIWVSMAFAGSGVDESILSAWNIILLSHKAFWRLLGVLGTQGLKPRILRSSYTTTMVPCVVSTASNFLTHLSLDRPNRRQAIIWTNVGPIHWRIYAALGGRWVITTGWIFLAHTVTLAIRRTYPTWS